jgi:hypothetical protein
MTALQTELLRLAGRRCPDHVWLREVLAPAEDVCFSRDRRGKLRIPGPCLAAYVVSLTDPAERGMWLEFTEGAKC